MSFLLLLAILVVALPIAYFLYVANSGAPYIPTPKRGAKKLLKLADIKPGEKVCDLGCGDGRLVILADQLYKADAVGYELSPPVYLLTKLYHWLKKTKTNAKIIFKDSRNVDFSDVDVVVTFLTPDPLKNFWREKWEAELKPTARVLSYAFEVEGWKPSHVEPQESEYNIAPIHVYKMSEIK